MKIARCTHVAAYRFISISFINGCYKSWHLTPWLAQSLEYKCTLSIVSEWGGTENDITLRNANALATFAQLRPMWQFRKLTRRIKLKIFGTSIKSVLQYRCDTKKITKAISNQLQVFVYRCLRQNLGIYWSETLMNENLRERCRESLIYQQIKRACGTGLGTPSGEGSWPHI